MWTRLLLVSFVLACGAEAEPAEEPPAELETETQTPAEARTEQSDESHRVPDGEHDPAFAEREESDDQTELSAATERARAGGKQVLLIFIADWCPDCHEVVRVSRLGEAAAVIEEKYEVVYMDVGGWDRHDTLRQQFQIEKIATLVVLDPDRNRIAQTTLEPISNHVELTPAALAEWLREPQDA